MQYNVNITSAAAFLTRRFNLPPHTAAVVAELAGLGRVGDWQPVGNAAVQPVLQAAAARRVRRSA